MVAFLPLTKTGQFLQMWEPVHGSNPTKPRQGKLVFIPKGQLVLVPGDTIHGGGFRADCRADNLHAHMRLHFYVYPGESRCMIDQHTNSYVENEGYAKYCNNAELKNNAKSLQTTFFQALLEK